MPTTRCRVLPPARSQQPLALVRAVAAAPPADARGRHQPHRRTTRPEPRLERAAAAGLRVRAARPAGTQGPRNAGPRTWGAVGASSSAGLPRALTRWARRCRCCSSCAAPWCTQAAAHAPEKHRSPEPAAQPGSPGGGARYGLRAPGGRALRAGYRTVRRGGFAHAPRALAAARGLAGDERSRPLFRPGQAAHQAVCHLATSPKRPAPAPARPAPHYRARALRRSLA